uniref:Uncharacterized protein n=1 Tax=Salix viminalis TaxID=40686 RepID=A0A6N2KM28_SALVM
MQKTKNKINVFKDKYILQLNAGGRKRVWSCRNEYLCSILELRLKTFSCGVGSTSIYANRSIPLASPCPKIAVSCNEGCSCPINLNSPTLSCPAISIPQAGVSPHSLFVWSHVCWVKLLHLRNRL